MSDIAIRTTQELDIPNSTEPAAIQLAQWAQAADAAFVIATKLSGTSFAPTAYRGKPEEATAAILAGAEVGLSPMASLRAFDNIQGTPAPKAITLRAIVQSLGHKVEIVGEPNGQTASVRGLRKGETDWQVSTWTIDRAEQMGLTGKAQWKQQPAAMLVARATAEVCRWIASDAIMGMPYTVEEIRDEGATFEARPRPQRITAAEILGTPVDTQPAEDPTDPLGAFAAADQIRPITAEQKQRIGDLLTERGITDRDAGLVGVSRVIGRDVQDANELTASEADQVIASLTGDNTLESAA